MQSRTVPAPSTTSSAPVSTTAEAPAFGVYVHWPFCAQKCPYCDFNSHVRFGGVDEARFVAAFERELDHAAALIAPSPASDPAIASDLSPLGRGEQRAPLFTSPGGASAPGRRTVTSIFFGGGTPSLMAPQTVAAILDHIARLWPVAPDAEITLEANPGSVEADRFRGYAQAGVNRVSLGVQALNDDVLRSLGRIHSVAEARRAVEIAQANFSRVSFDLIYARPKQTVEQWRAELSEALALAVGHLSLYQLTIEPETPFAALHAAGKLVVPDEDAAHALYDVTQELTQAAGLPAYEISNHAVPGEESRHNLLYWRYGEYAGCGPGAHGRLIVDGVRRATATERQPERWAERVEQGGHGWTEDVALSQSEATDERLLMGLRLREGIDVERLTGSTIAAAFTATIAELKELSLLETVPDDARGRRIRATPKGRFILNEIVLRLAMGLAAALDDNNGAQKPIDNLIAAD
jgi:putative oxygen-independent coproporphyrinogen III oxidase